jgi:hypothetical protein
MVNRLRLIRIAAVVVAALVALVMGGGQASTSFFISAAVLPNSGFIAGGNTITTPSSPIRPTPTHPR